MNELESCVFMLNGIIGDMPGDDQKRIYECRNVIKKTISEYGDHGLIALSLVGAEQSLRDSKK